MAVCVTKSNVKKGIHMGKFEKLRQRILNGASDANIDFKALCNLLVRLQFVERIKGDHYFLAKEGVEEIINLQPIGSKAKPYQVKQVRNLIVNYRLGDKNVD